jgi:hypothetical protein
VTNDETCADELFAAAKTLREAAKVATAGPWKASPVWSGRSHAKSAVYSHAHRAGSTESEVVASGLRDRAGGIVQPGNAVWIAAVHPGLADPLAAWLEREALWTEQVGNGIPRDLEALAVARAINSA